MVETTQIVAAVSVAVGLGLLVSSSLFLDDWRKQNAKCTFDLELCKILKYYVIGACFGISAALIQFVACVAGLLQKWQLWCLLHILVGISAIIAFALPMEKNADSIKWYIGDDGPKLRAKIFLAFTGIEFIFCLIAIGIVYCTNRNRR